MKLIAITKGQAMIWLGEFQGNSKFSLKWFKQKVTYVCDLARSLLVADCWQQLSGLLIYTLAILILLDFPCVCASHSHNMTVTVDVLS